MAVVGGLRGVDSCSVVLMRTGATGRFLVLPGSHRSVGSAVAHSEAFPVPRVGPMLPTGPAQRAREELLDWLARRGLRVGGRRRLGRGAPDQAHALALRVNEPGEDLRVDLLLGRAVRVQRLRQDRILAIRLAQQQLQVGGEVIPDRCVLHARNLGGGPRALQRPGGAHPPTGG